LVPLNERIKFTNKVRQIVDGKISKQYSPDRISGKLKLGVDVYFVHSYHSWERGLSENTNGLIRQHFPKKTDLQEISGKEVLQVIFFNTILDNILPFL
jgi:hypothetical protein